MEHRPEDDADKVIRYQRVSEYLAYERTLLAYIRPSIAIIGLGIAVNRFSLYLAETGKIKEHPKLILQDTEHVGVGLVVFGMLVMIYGAIRYGQTVRVIDLGVYRPKRIMVYALTLLMLPIGSVSLFWLFWR